MAPKKVSPHAHIPNGFEVHPDQDTAADFPHQRHITIVLNAAHSQYDVQQKAIPAHLKGRQHGGKDIHWMNNFGLLGKGKPEFDPEVPEYEILLDKFDNCVYVYHDGDIQVLPTQPYPADPGKVRAVLHLGDPSIGWGG